jgi:protein TonB
MISSLDDVAAPAAKKPASGPRGSDRAAPRARPDTPSASAAGELLGTILVTSACVHLLAAGLTGFGIRPDPVRHHKPDTTSIASVVQEVQLEPPPPPPPAKDATPPPLDDPASLAAPAAANIDLPPLPPTVEITAVPATVPVAFAIPVKGPVRLVKDAAHASGAVGGRPSGTGPISVDAGAEHARFLLLPQLKYPQAALQRHMTGTVKIEFRTSPTGDIYDLKIQAGSGFIELDNAALQNMRRGRWTGEAGFFVKSFNFVLN